MKIKVALLISLLTAFLTGTAALASFYSGVQYHAAYGVWASITTPATMVHIYNRPEGQESLEANWVSLPYPNWMQSGWVYKYLSNNTLHGPVQYIETCINGCSGPPPRYYTEFNNQNWGTSVSYMINNEPPGSNTWCTYINGVQKKCQSGIVTPPVTVEVYSEIHINADNELNTNFNNIKYKGSDYIWHAFDGNEILPLPDLPYARKVINPDNIKTYRLNTINLPIITK